MKDIIETLLLCESVLQQMARIDDGTPSISALNDVRKMLDKYTPEKGAQGYKAVANILAEQTSLAYEAAKLRKATEKLGTVLDMPEQLQTVINILMTERYYTKCQR